MCFEIRHGRRHQYLISIPSLLSQYNLIIISISQRSHCQCVQASLFFSVCIALPLSHVNINSFHEDSASRWAGKDIFRLLWKPEFHYRIYKILPLDCILSQFDLIHTL